MHTRRPLWDVFCRVVDNHGDLGVAWRLAADLASRSVDVRLWVDEPAALGWMAPGGPAGARDRDGAGPGGRVDVIHWTAESPDLAPGDVAVETFGCDLPPRFLQRMAAAVPGSATAWIDLEYLSAEGYVERSHGLASPISAAPGRTLKRRFYYPGFTARTGGLLREPGLLGARRRFDRGAWLAAAGVALRPGERLASRFCYADAPLAALWDALADRPTLLLALPGPAAAQLEARLGPALHRGGLRVQKRDWLPQTDYDRLLWSCDLNFVRGEDSFVRAQWAGAPFVWQIYPQDDRAHAAKLAAFLDALLPDADATLAGDLRRLFLGWNRLGDAPGPLVLPAEAPWRALCERWREHLAAQPDLTTQLLAFAERVRGEDRAMSSPANGDR